MASFKLITENRDELYYKKYEYKAVFKIPHVGRTRYCKNFSEFKTRIEYLRNRGWLTFNFDKKRTTIFQNFFLWKSKVDLSAISMRLDINSLAIYSNDLEILKDAATYFEYNPPIYKQAVANAPVGVKYFKRTPPTNYRVYFKSGKVSSNFYSNLQDLFDRYKDSSIQFYPSRSLELWMLKSSGWARTWVRNSFSIGYNNESDYTILALTIPEMLGKNYKLEKQ
jgi:hypothetical protein